MFFYQIYIICQNTICFVFIEHNENIVFKTYGVGGCGGLKTTTTMMMMMKMMMTMMMIMMVMICTPSPDFASGNTNKSCIY